MKSALFLLLGFSPIFAWAGLPGGGGRLEARIVDDLTGQPLAARVVDNPDLRNRILPRNVSVFAHTSPVYFLKDGQKVREPASVAYLRKYVEGTLHWLGTHPAFFDERDRQNAQRDAEEALRVYRSL